MDQTEYSSDEGFSSNKELLSIPYSNSHLGYLKSNQGQLMILL